MKSAVFLALTFFGLSAFAQETWVGFKPVEKTNLPFKEYLENSVVLIASVSEVGELKDKAVEIVDVSKIKAVTDEKKLAPSADPTKVQPNLRAIQIETCRTQGLQFCPVIKVSMMSTGFFEDGKKLNSCRHSYNNWLAWASQANGNVPVETLSPPMILYSKDRKILYNSATVPKEQLLKFSFLNTDPKANILDFKPPKSDWMKYLTYDVAQLTANTNLVAPQSVSYDTNINVYSASAPMYVVGYPGKTKYFSNGKGDAPGGKLVVSVGKIQKIHFEEHVVMTNNLSKTGLSGGPLFNEYGDIMGTFCSWNPPLEVDHPETAESYFVILNQTVLKDLWASLVF